VLAHVHPGGVQRVFPTRFSDTPVGHILVSSDYSLGGIISWVRIDDVAGYYRLDSLKNLRFSVAFFGLRVLAAICC